MPLISLACVLRQIYTDGASRVHARYVNQRHPRRFGFILRRRSRLRGFVILPSDRSGGALIRIRYAARRRADRLIDRLCRILISTFAPWSRPPNILAGHTFAVSHKSPWNYRPGMKLLCPLNHNGGASRSDVGDRRAKLGSESAASESCNRTAPYRPTRRLGLYI